MKQLFLSLMLLSSLSVNAQRGMTYSYDAAGNRVSRVLELATSGAKSRQATQSQSFFDEIDGKQVRIYSNSSMGHVLVEMLGKGDSPMTLSVYNTSGMQIFSQSQQEERLDVDLSQQPAGIYILTIEVNNEKQSWKIVKK